MRLGWREWRMGNNGFKKEYVTGRKDQWDIDYKIMMKGYQTTKSKEQFFEFLKEYLFSSPPLFFIDPDGWTAVILNRKVFS